MYRLIGQRLRIHVILNECIEGDYLEKSYDMYSLSLRVLLFPGKVTFRVAISTEPDPQGTSRVDIHTHPYTTAACAAGVVPKTTDRDSLRYTHNGIRRVCQLALGCESN